MGGKKSGTDTNSAILMDVCKYWYKNWTAKDPVKLLLSTKDKEEFEIFKKVH